MQTIYASTRRLIAALLIVALVVYGVVSALRGFDTTALVVIGSVGVASILLLVAVVTRSRPRFGLDMLAFLATGLAVAVSWGSASIEPGFLVFLPALVVAVAFATMALMLRTEAGAVVTSDRL